jgi:sugar lactone lactonase YvrE
MKKILLLLSSSIICFSTFSQTYNSPESIEFDSANNRWLIANTGGGNILSRSSSTGVLTEFTALPSSPYGIEIVGSTLFVCDQISHVKGYNLTTAAQVMNLTISGASFLNGITHDNNGNLYVTDFTARKIYRINIATQQYNVFVTSTSSVTGTKPNGIIFDEPNNRCVFVNWGTNAPIKAVNLADSTVTTLTTTTLTNIDGIAKDGAGNYFVSSWGLNGIAKFNNSFTTGPTTVVTGLSSPADIFYNVLTDTLANPNSGTLNNTTYHYFGSTTEVAEHKENNNLNISVNPNPVFKAAEINYVLPENGKVTVRLYDLKGSLVKTIVDEEQTKGAQTTFFSKANLAAGQYILQI